ncbi:MAG: transposase [candidate division Zixibacteria bacterium]
MPDAQQQALVHLSVMKLNIYFRVFVYYKLTGVASEIRENPEAGMASDLDAIAREGARRMLISTLEAEVMRNLKARGLTDPKLFVGDSALGLWGAIETVYPEADHQRCWVHKMRNVMVHFPKRLHAEVKRLLRQMYDATTRKQAETFMQQFPELYGRMYPRAVECSLKDKDALLTYFDYPQER